MDNEFKEKIIVSVIIPVYNVEAYIEECFSSIFQNIDPRFEFICIDDGSTDGCSKICDSYAKKYADCRVVHTENRGIGPARNVGLEMARGEYIAFIDPDDYVAEDWAQSILTAIEEQQCDLLFFDYCTVENTKLAMRCYGEKTGLVNKDEFLQDVVTDRKIKSHVWQKVFKASLFEGIYFPEKRKCLEDYSILHLLLDRVQSIYYIRKSLYFYRIRSERATEPVNLLYCYDNYLTAKERYEYYIDKQVKVPPIGMYVQVLLFCVSYWQAEPVQREHYAQKYVALKKIVSDNILSVLQTDNLDFKFKLKYMLVYLNLDCLLAMYLRYGVSGALKSLLIYTK